MQKLSIVVNGFGELYKAYNCGTIPIESKINALTDEAKKSRIEK